MVPDYDDDDIIEDYDEITDSSGARRVSSGQGGPVKRPSGGVRPSTTAMPAVGGPGGEFQGPPKGKISHKSAKLIWIICIVIIVLGIGAVVVDYVVDPLDRHKAGQASGGNNAPVQANHTPPPREVLSPEEQAQLDFKKKVVALMAEMDKSKAWDFYWTSALEFDNAYDALIAARNKKDSIPAEELEGAYAEAIKFYYKAKYAGALFRHHFDEDNISKEYIAINMSGDEVTMLNTKDLTNPKIQKFQAASSKIDGRSTRVNKFQTDFLKYDVMAGHVHDSQEWKDKVFGVYEDRWTAANDMNPVFNQEDLDFVNGPDYAANEKKMWQKFLDEHGSK